MAITYGRALGQTNGQVTSGAGTLVLTTSAAHNAGEEIIVAVAADGCRTFSSVTDSASNTYTAIASATTGGGNTDSKTAIYRSAGTNALASGQTITFTTTGLTTGGACMGAVTCLGVSNATDASNTATGASGEPTQTLTTVAKNTIMFASTCQQEGIAGTGYIEDSTAGAEWTNIYTEIFNVANSVCLNFAYRIVSTVQAPDTYNPTTGHNVKWALVLGSLADALVAQSKNCLMPAGLAV